MTQTRGRREGETPEWKPSPAKIVSLVVVPIITGAVILWGGWISKCAVAGAQAKDDVATLKAESTKMDGILHERVSDQDNKRTAAVSKLTDKMDQVKAAAAAQYQAIMNQLIEIQRDINRSNP
jgi:hypothetical protein